MNDLEHQLQYPFGEDLPLEGRTIEVAPGVRWIRMSLPFALNHINLWLLRDNIGDRPGWTVVDCCVSQDAARRQWEAIFESELEGLPILRVIVTHMHPDHIGLANWLCSRWDVPLYISATDYYAARVTVTGGSTNGGEAAAAFFEQHGLSDPGAVAAIRDRKNYYSNLVPEIPKAYRRIRDGDVISIGGCDWTCISGYGHSPEHISLYRSQKGLLIGGDMMLPRISTNVSVYCSEPEANPLQEFLDSIDKFLRLPGATLVLPSHGKPFLGLHTRVAQLHDHHSRHLSATVLACSDVARSAAEILPVLFSRKLDVHQITFAMGEAIAHLHMLWKAGRLARRSRSNGVFEFQAV